MIKSLFTGENIPEGPRPAYLLSRSLMRMLWAQLADFKYLYLLGTICLISTHYIQSQLPFLAKDLVDVLSRKEAFSDYWVLILFSVGIIFFRTFSRLLFFFPARISERDFRKVLISKLEQCTPERYRSMSSGDVFQTVFSDTEQVRAFLGFAVLQFGNVFIACAVLIPQIIKFNPDLLIALLPMAISFILFTVIVGKTRRYQKIALDAQADVQNNIIETYQGKETIKNFHAEDSFVNNFERLSYKELINFYKTGIGVSFSIPMIPLGVGISLLWGALIIYQSNMGASSLIVFSGITFLFLEPLAFISWIGVVYIASNAAWGRIRRLVKKIETEDPRENFLNQHNSFDGEASFKLEFWESELNFNIPKEKKLVIVAETGVGKTELIHQLVYCLKKSGYSLGYVSQNPYIFDDTMEKNLFLGNEVSEELLERTEKLLKIFKLDDLGNSLQDILKMPLGENGKRLSGGQMKRVCLIRSLLHSHEFLLWDDPFSSIDLIMEGQIIKSLNELGLLKGKTIILSSHRLSTVRLCDELIYLKKEEGISAQGKCEELLETSLPLQEFFKEQMVEMN